MDLDEAVTITPLNINGKRWYMLIGWLANSFKLYLYTQEDVWKGTFSYNRLITFSRSFNMTENEYFSSIKRCLSKQRNDYDYELTDGFFFWKQRVPKGSKGNKHNTMKIIRGFMPIELDTSLKNTRLDLIEILLAINKQLRFKSKELITQYGKIRRGYEECLKDTHEFFRLKIEMEKDMCRKFLNTLNVKQSGLGSIDLSQSVYKETKQLIDQLRSSNNGSRQELNFNKESKF